MQNSSNATEHADYVWKHYVKEGTPKHIAVIAHSYGGFLTVDLVSQWICTPIYIYIFFLVCVCACVRACVGWKLVRVWWQVVLELCIVQLMITDFHLIKFWSGLLLWNAHPSPPPPVPLLYNICIEPQSYKNNGLLPACVLDSLKAG